MTGMILAPVVFVASAGRPLAVAPLRTRRGVARQAAARALKEKELVAQAERGVGSGEGFYNSLAQLLQARAARRAGPEGEGCRVASAARAARAARGRGGGRRAARRLLDRCDAARFGAAASETAEQRRAALDEGLALLRRSSLTRKGAA
jgi:hypothetical protein